MARSLRETKMQDAAKKQPPPASAKKSATKLEALGLRQPVFYALRNEGLNTVAKLCRKTEVDLLRTPNLGRKSLRQIKEALRRIGRELKP